MREIVHLQFGQCGSKIGTEFWEGLCMEHGIGTTGHYEGDNDHHLERINTYFDNVQGLKYVPRAVLVDLDADGMNFLKSNPIGQVMGSQNLVFGGQKTDNNWAKGFYSDGAEKMETVLNVLRKEVERCDFAQGFQIMHSLGGGTGSGMGCLMLQKLKDEYREKVFTTYTVFPSQKTTYAANEPYNVILSMPHLIENSTETFCIDNEALFNNRMRSTESPTIPAMNKLVGPVMCGITAPFRFPGRLNANLRKLAVNLVPLPRLHFLTPGYAPFSEGETQSNLTVSQLTQQVLDDKNMLVSCTPSTGKYLGLSAIYRGKLSQREVNEQMYNMQIANSTQFPKWIPDNLKSSVNTFPPNGVNASATIIANTTSVKELFIRISQQVTKMIKYGSFLHVYKKEGMEIKEFEDAQNSVSDLINEYQQC
ncbi:tubulin beta-1 chain-like [Ciona intestinalis]